MSDYRSHEQLEPPKQSSETCGLQNYPPSRDALRSRAAYVSSRFIVWQLHSRALDKSVVLPKPVRVFIPALGSPHAKRNLEHYLFNVSLRLGIQSFCGQSAHADSKCFRCALNGMRAGGDTIYPVVAYVFDVKNMSYPALQVPKLRKRNTFFS